MRRLEDIEVPEYQDSPTSARQRALLVRRLQKLHRLAVQLTDIGALVATSKGMTRVPRPHCVSLFRGHEPVLYADDYRISWPFYGFGTSGGRPFANSGDHCEWYNQIRYLDFQVMLHDPRLPDILLALCFDREDVTMLIHNVGRCIKAAETTLSEIALLGLEESA